jgi:hypothetical protein
MEPALRCCDHIALGFDCSRPEESRPVCESGGHGEGGGVGYNLGATSAEGKGGFGEAEVETD